MKSVIERIIVGDNVELILNKTLDHIYTYGPIDQSDLEVLTYIKLYHPGIFAEREKSIV